MRAYLDARDAFDRIEAGQGRPEELRIRLRLLRKHIAEVHGEAVGLVRAGRRGRGRAGDAPGE